MPLIIGCHDEALSVKDILKIKLRNVMNILPKKAAQNPETVKPRTSEETKSNIRALITSKKKPNVTNVKGKVSIIKIGLIIAFAKPSKTAEMMRDEQSTKRIPLNI